MVEKPIVLPLVCTFTLNAVTHPFQNLTVKLAVDGLTREYEFLVDNALDVGKNNQHGLDIAANLTHFFWLR
jgi:dihydropteroate synthase